MRGTWGTTTLQWREGEERRHGRSEGDRSEGGWMAEDSSFQVKFMCAACVRPTQTLRELAVLSGLKLHFIGHCV